MKRLAWALLTVVAGCEGDNLTCLCVPVMTSVSEAWAGAPVTLSSTAFAGIDSMPALVTAAAETLHVAMAGANTIAVTMPQHDGSYTVAVTLHSGEVLKTDEVRVHGFLGTMLGPQVSGRVQPVAGFSNPTGIVFGMDRRLTLLNLNTGAALPLGSPDDTGFGAPCASGVTPSAPNPNVITVSRVVGGLCPVYAVSIGGALTYLDSTPHFTGSVYASAYLGAGRWVVGEKYAAIVVTGPGASYSDPCVSPIGMAVAPSPGSLVVPIGCSRQGGVQVWAPLTGQHPYILNHLRDVEAAAFSGHGDTLFVAGRSADSTGSMWLYAVDAAAGIVRDSAPIAFFESQGAFSDIVVDPNGRWLYVANGYYNLPSDVTVKVFDRNTLREAAAWHTPRIPADQGFDLWLWRLVVGADRVLYLATTDVDVDPARARIYRWSLMP